MMIENGGRRIDCPFVMIFLVGVRVRVGVRNYEHFVRGLVRLVLVAVRFLCRRVSRFGRALPVVVVAIDDDADDVVLLAVLVVLAAVAADPLVLEVVNDEDDGDGAELVSFFSSSCYYCRLSWYLYHQRREKRVR